MLRRDFPLVVSDEELGDDEVLLGEDEWGEDDDCGGDEGTEDN